MTTTQLREHIALHRLVWVVPLTLVYTVIVNLIIVPSQSRSLGFLRHSKTCRLRMSFGSTIIFVLLAMLVFVLVDRYAKRRIQFYRLLAFFVLCVSFLSPIMALVGLIPAPGMTLSIFWTMIVLHIVSAIIVVSLLTAPMREQV